MADQVSPFQLDDIPLAEARRVSRGPRMDPQLYHELTTRLLPLADHAVRITVPDDTSQTTMRSRILRVAAEHGIPVTIRRVPGGLLFWRSTAEEVQQAKEVGIRLQTGQRRHTRPGRRRRA